MKERPKPKSINDQLWEAHEKARLTGKRVRLRFPKKQFLEENPDAAADPRLAVTGDMMMVDFESYEEVQVKDLREICAANPDHHLSPAKRLSVLGLTDETFVTVLRSDLTSLKEDIGKKSVEAEAPAKPLTKPVKKGEPIKDTDRPPI